MNSLQQRAAEVQAIFASGNQNKIDANRKKIDEFAQDAAAALPMALEALICAAPEKQAEAIAEILRVFGNP